MIALHFPRRIRAQPVNSGCMPMLAALLLACAPVGSLGKDEPAGTGDGSSTAATAEGSGTAGTADGSGMGFAGSSDASSSTAGDEGSTTAAAVCPPAPDDTACETCLKGHCCEASTACQASEPCTCIDACIAEGGDAAACVEHCGGPNDDWTHLHDCSAEQCVDVC